MQVNPDRQTWKCWVCDIGGDAFSWVMKQEGCDFVEALKMLAERAGIALEPGRQKHVEPGSPDDKNALYAASSWAERQFHECLLNSDSARLAREYVESRRLSAESIAKFKIGFAPDSWSWLLDRARNSPHSPAVLEAVGLLGRSATTDRLYDRFKGRLIFPIRDAQGRTIAFGGRILPALKEENSAKYINSPETRLFSKSEHLYALDIARATVGKTREITIVEGYTDVVMCHQHGVDDVVAVLGTALTERHIPLLRRFADTIYLVLDGDEAGQRRTNEILQLFVAAQMDLRILTLPEEFDPDEYLQERGGPAFRDLRKGAIDALEHKIRIATRGIDLARDTHRANQALEDILATISRAAAPGALDTNTLRLQQLLARLAREFHLEETDLRTRFRDLRRNVKLPVVAVDSEFSEETVEPVYKLASLTPRESELLELLAAHWELAPTALAEIADDDLTAPAAKALFQTYRELEEAGEDLEFGRVLAEIENASLKSVLVQLADLAEAKASKADLDPPTRMRAVIRSFLVHHQQRELRETEDALARKQFNEQEELDVLQELIATKRRQQGIIAPTEG
jgi:DNA primase